MRRRPATSRPHTAELEICAACGADYVNPLEWTAIEDHSWWMLLRCAQCEHQREVVVDNDEATRFDEALDRRADPIARTLHRLDVDRMETWVEALTVALQRDLIDAADFAR
jgi:NMD protein affecting ribosome stability and mRNA decay